MTKLVASVFNLAGRACGRIDGLTSMHTACKDDAPSAIEEVAGPLARTKTFAIFPPLLRLINQLRRHWLDLWPMLRRIRLRAMLAFHRSRLQGHVWPAALHLIHALVYT